MTHTFFAQAFPAEMLKIKRSRVVWITFSIFALAPLMGGLFMLILRYPEAFASAGMMKQKAVAASLSPDWNALLLILSQSIGVGGVLVFGFVASWLFGREYSDGTAKDLLAIPTTRAEIIQAKFLVYVAWCFALAASNLCIGLLIGFALQLPDWTAAIFIQNIQTYFLTTLLTILVGTPVAVMSLIGKGYLAPLGFVSLILVLAQIIGAAGFGAYFPWAVPGLFSGAAGEFKAALNLTSYGVVLGTGIIGYMTTIWYWSATDHIH